MGGLVNGNETKRDLWMIEGAGASLVLSAAKGDASIVGTNGLVGMPCYPVTSVTAGPGPRIGHRSLLVGNAFIVFGGDTKASPDDPLDDTLYLLNTSSRQWSRAIPPGPRPRGRYGHTMNIVGSKIYVFGGQSDHEGFFNDLVCFDLNALQKASNHWQFLIENTADSESGELPVDENTGKPLIPPARTNHTMVTFNDRLWLFGGTDGVHWFNDAWVYDPRTNAWQSIDYVGVTPTPREGHAAAMVGDIMYVFGGRNAAGEDLDDLVAFRCTQRRWYTFQKMGPAPSPRSGHAMSVFGRWIIVIGGSPNKADESTDEELELVYVLDTGKIRYPDSPPMHGHQGPGGNTPGHLMHPNHQRTTSPHGVAMQQSDRGRDSNAAAMQRRMMSPTRAGAPGPGPGQSADGQYQSFGRTSSELDNQPQQQQAQQQQPRRGTGPMGSGSRPLPPGQRPRGPGSFSTSPQPANTPPRSPQPGMHGSTPSMSTSKSMPNISESADQCQGQERPSSQQQMGHARRTSRSASTSSTSARHAPSSSQTHIQTPNDEGWSGNMSTEPIQEEPEDSDEEHKQHQQSQSKQGLPPPPPQQQQQHPPRTSSAASNGTSPTPRQSRSPAPTLGDGDETESQNGSINSGVGKPLHKVSSRLGSIAGSRTGSPAEQPQQNRPRRVSSAQQGPSMANMQDTNAVARSNPVPEIEVAAPHAENATSPTYAAITAGGAAAGAACAPGHTHQQSQGSRRTPSNATSVSNYTTNSTISAATVPVGQRDSTQNGQSSLQHHGSNASGTKVAARAMEAGEAAPLVRPPSGHRRHRGVSGSIGSMGSRSRDSIYSVGAPGPATHDGGEIEDSMLSVTLGAPALSSSNSSATSVQQHQPQQQQQQHQHSPQLGEPKRNSKRISVGDWDAPKSPRLNAHQEALMKELDAVKKKNAWFAGELALARKAGYVPSSITPAISTGPSALSDKFRSVSHGSTSSFGSSFGGTLSNADSESFGGGANAGAGPTSAGMSKHASLHGLNALEQDSAGLKDEDKPLLEALLAMRAELVTMQSTVEQQASTAARKVAEIEQQRDVAIREAVYAQAKLAALGGNAAVSRSGTSMSDNSRSATPTNAVSTKEKELREKDFDTLHAERATDMSRRLALALVAQNDMKQRLDTLTAELKEEQHARQIAEELRDATSQRLNELESKSRDLVELESLRAELTALHDALNEEQTARAHAESQIKLAEIDKNELEDKLEEAELLASGSADNFAALREAVFASEEKASHVAKQLAETEERVEILGQQLREARAAVEEKTVHGQDLERQVTESTDMVQLLQRRSEEDRLAREDLERQLLEIKAERDSILAESEETRRKLRDASEIAEKHAREAETHRAAFLAGLDRVASSRNLKGSVAGSDAGSEHHPISDERVSALRDQIDRANERARAHQEAAEAATEKLRRAEERIAGLEAYQEQSAREGLQLRRQLQVATREARILALEVRDVKAQLETQQRDANALLVQHNALKELLNDRNVHYSDSTRRSPRLESPAFNSNPSRFGTPEHARLRELEQQLQANIKAHEETKTLNEQREQEAEKTYNEKLEQLGKDYRSAVHYVKGTEKMLRRMKDELEKYKTQNAKFQAELETVGRQSSSSEYSSRAAAEWENERTHLQSALADAQEKMSSAVVELESQVSKLHEDVAAARAERDKARRAEEALEQELYELGEKHRAEIARLRSENAALESRASDAERRVMMLLESSITAQQAQSGGAVRRTQSNASSDTIGRILSRSRGNSVSTLSREIDPDSENIPLRSHSAAAAVTNGTAGGLRPIAQHTGDHHVDQRTSLALDSLTSELDALRSHWEASNRRNYRLSSNTLDPDREELARVNEGYENGGEDGKEEPLVLSESLVGWRKKLEEEEQRASMVDKEKERQSAGSRTPVGASTNSMTGNGNPARDVESPVMPVGVTVTADNMI